MRLVKLQIVNFRLLHQCSINMEQMGAATILVGPNHGGKTLAAEALKQFTVPSQRPFIASDFSLRCRSGLKKVEASYAADEPLPAPPELPTLSMTLFLAVGASYPTKIILAMRSGGVCAFLRCGKHLTYEGKADNDAYVGEVAQIIERDRRGGRSPTLHGRSSKIIFSMLCLSLAIRMAPV